MVAVEVTPSIQTILASANLSHLVRTTADVSTVPHKALCDALRATAATLSLSSLLRDTNLHLSHADAVALHAPPKRDAQVAARVARLRARLDDAAYAHMTRDVARVAGSNAEVESLRMSKFAPQMSLGANVIVTMATCFTAGYFVAKNSTGSQTYGLVGGVVGLVVAMGVEVVLLMTRMHAVESEAERQRRRREKRAERNAGVE